MKNRMPQHYAQTTVQHIPLHAGWPNGEPQSVRDAYDAEQAAKAAQGGTS